MMRWPTMPRLRAAGSVGPYGTGVGEVAFTVRLSQAESKGAIAATLTFTGKSIRKSWGLVPLFEIWNDRRAPMPTVRFSGWIVQFVADSSASSTFVIGLACGGGPQNF